MSSPRERILDTIVRAVGGLRPIPAVARVSGIAAASWRRSSDSSYRRPSSADTVCHSSRVNSAPDAVRRFGRRAVAIMPRTPPVRRHLQGRIASEICADAGCVTVTCPFCQSELQVTETHSGWRGVSVARFGRWEGWRRRGLERLALSASGDVQCPACNSLIDRWATPRTLGTASVRLRRIA